MGCFLHRRVRFRHFVFGHFDWYPPPCPMYMKTMIRVHIYVHLSAYVNIYYNICLYTYTYMFIYIFIYTYVYIYTHTYVNINTRKYVCMCVYMHRFIERLFCRRDLICNDVIAFIAATPRTGSVTMGRSLFGNSTLRMALVQPNRSDSLHTTGHLLMPCTLIALWIMTVLFTYTGSLQHRDTHTLQHSFVFDNVYRVTATHTHTHALQHSTVFDC